jgi:hypothetical protein
MKGTSMKFHGYWVSKETGKISVTSGEFDDTELSDHSDWKEAWQNADPDAAHGFLDPLAMLHDISKRIVGNIYAAGLDEAATNFHDGAPCPVDDLQDLARLIQLVIPKGLPHPALRKVSPPVGNGDANIDF